MESINLAMLLATKMLSETSTIILRRDKPVSTNDFLVKSQAPQYLVYDMFIKINQIPPPAPSENLVLLFADCELEENPWKRMIFI